MNVLHFYKTYYPDSFGGVEHVIFHLTELNHIKDVECQILSLSRDPTKPYVSANNVNVVKAKELVSIASTPFSYDVIYKFKKLAQKADIIHYHFPFPFMDMIHFLTDIDKPTVVTYHSDIIKQKNLLKVYTPLMNRFLKSVSAIVATSPNYFNTSKTLQKFASKVKVIPIGIDANAYAFDDASRVEYWKQKLPAKFLLFVGALRYYKGLDILLDALKQSAATVVIVGAGPSEQRLKEKARTLGLDNIMFLDGVSEKDKCIILSLCYGVVFPSHLRTEAFGVSLLEGALFSKPIISCEIGTGTTYINIDRETGLVAKPNDPHSLCEVMDELWQDEEQAREFGINAKKRFENLFTAKHMNEEYYRLYRSLL